MWNIKQRSEGMGREEVWSDGSYSTIAVVHLVKCVWCPKLNNLPMHFWTPLDEYAYLIVDIWIVLYWMTLNLATWLCKTSSLHCCKIIPIYTNTSTLHSSEPHFFCLRSLLFCYCCFMCQFGGSFIYLDLTRILSACVSLSLLFNSIFIFIDGSGADIFVGDGCDGDGRVLFHRKNVYIMDTFRHTRYLNFTFIHW